MVAENRGGLPHHLSNPLCMVDSQAYLVTSMIYYCF